MRDRPRSDEVTMFWRAVRSVTIALAAGVAVTVLPDLARYLRMREM